MRQSWLIASTAAWAGSLLLACSVDEVDLEGKACPCADGWECDAATQTCHRPVAAGGGAGGTEGGLGGAGTGGTGGNGGSGGVGASGGSGGTGQCAAGQKLCGTACVSTTSPTFGCSGSSCDPCPSGPNSTASCTGGACSLSCSSGFGDCDGVASTGCEQGLAASDSANCGACGRACVAANANASACTGSSCLPSCNPGFADCNESTKPQPDDGCETNVGTSSEHCGSCGNACSVQGGATTKFQCFSGVCGCSAAADCMLTTNIQGAACESTHVCSCSGAQCRAGEICVKDGPGAKCGCNGGTACTTAQVCCPLDGCVDLSISVQNCGACGNACPSGKTCSAGVCS